MEQLQINPNADFSEEQRQAVRQYRYGIFETTALRIMLTLLQFPTYKPDRSVKTFNDTRFSKLELGQPSYTNPNSSSSSRKKGRELGSNKATRGARRYRERKFTRSFFSSDEIDNDPDDQEAIHFFSSAANGMRCIPAKRAKTSMPKFPLPPDRWCANERCKQRNTHMFMFHTCQKLEYLQPRIKYSP